MQPGRQRKEEEEEEEEVKEFGLWTADYFWVFFIIYIPPPPIINFIEIFQCL